MADTYAARVKRGARLLDEKVPGWAGKVNVERLDMTDCESCVVGQVFGEFMEGVEEIKPDYKTWEAWVTRRGYWADTLTKYPRLDALWRAEIERRR